MKAIAQAVVGNRVRGYFTGRQRYVESNRLQRGGGNLSRPRGWRSMTKEPQVPNFEPKANLGPKLRPGHDAGH